MHIRWIPLLAAAVLGLVSGSEVPAQAATIWYVDNAVHGGANNGTSWANAWTSFAAIHWSSVHPGDSVYISGGSASQTYTESWSVGASGTSGSPITIGIDASNPSHNGTVIFDYNGDGDVSTRTGITVAQNYITLTGNVNGSSHIQLNNLRNILDRNAPIGIYGYGPTGDVVDYCTFINDNNPVRFDSPSAVTIRNSSFQQVRGDAAISMNGSSGSWDNNQIYNNSIELLENQAVPPGGSGLYYGPDGIQGSDGISIHNNTIKQTTTTVYTSSQHPDMMQITGDYVKVYDNDFINVGDSVFDYDCYANSTPHDIWLYNNTFRIVTSIDPYPEYFRMYCSVGSMVSITNVKFMNNTFIDNDYSWGRVIWFGDFNGNPTASGIEFKNNIWYNAGNNAPGPAIWVDSSTGFNSSSFSFDYNVYYQTSGTTYFQFGGTSYTAPNWIAAHEPHSTTGRPLFVSYVPNGANNDLHLQSADTVAQDKGVSMAPNFTTDHDGVTRPQGAAWDIGAYEVPAPTFGPLITFAPSQLIFAKQAVNTSSPPQTVTVSNTGTTTLNLTGIGIRGTNATDFSKTTTCGATLAPLASCTVAVTFRPTAIGKRTASLAFSDNAPGSPQTVPLSGTTPGVIGMVHATSCGPQNFPASTCTIPATGSGNAIAVAWASNNGGGLTNIASIVDNAGNTYQEAGNARAVDAGPNSMIDIWYAKNSKPGATTLTITTSPSGVKGTAVIWEFAGVDKNAPLVQTAVLNSQPATTTPSGAPVTITAGSSVVISAANIQGAVTGLVSGNPFTSDSLANGDGWAHLITYTAGSSVAAKWNNSSSGTYASSTISFKGATTPALNACDLNRDGVVDLTDVQLAMEMVRGVSQCTANVLGSGVCNMAVVQRVNDAASGGACLAQ